MQTFKLAGENSIHPMDNKKGKTNKQNKSVEICLMINSTFPALELHDKGKTCPSTS